MLEDGDYAATAVTFGPQQDIREGIPLTDDDLLLLDDDDEDTEEYDWYNEPPADDYGNLDIDWAIEIDLEFFAKCDIIEPS